MAVTGQSQVLINLTFYLIVKVATMWGVNPASQAISNIGSIAVSRVTFAKIARRIDRAAVIDSGSLVVGRHVTSARMIETLGKTITVIGARCPISYHGEDGTGRAGVLHHRLVADLVIAGAGAIEGLHEAWIAIGTEARGDADTAARLLHDYGQDQTMIHVSFLSDLLDGVVDGADLWSGSIGLPVTLAIVFHGVFVVVEPSGVSDVSFFFCLGRVLSQSDISLELG